MTEIVGSLQRIASGAGVCAACGNPAPIPTERSRLRVGRYFVPLCVTCSTEHIMVTTYCTDCRAPTVYAVAEKQPACWVCADKPKRQEPEVERKAEQTVTVPELSDVKHKKRRR